MFASKYNLRTTCRSSHTQEGSEDTIDNVDLGVEVNPSQVTTQPPPTVEHVIRIDTVDPGQSSKSMEQANTTPQEDTVPGLHLYGKEIQTDLLQDVISTYRVKRTHLLHLCHCRLVINESIRIVRENVVALGPMFRDMGYFKELGVFLVSSEKNWGARA
ncbi:hypothetical protein O6H91_18G013800 [Diphasiastrum complanatum]|uniref:Uncharacterized protein n=1 Tax=Diphasiastrum complanatum TaxID=34168 RepID=A0ACC2AY69_DIPCM|nr:hypothetical protein O6H91_Y462700 [Diphasiastrum complanatum]KAJ7522492.1 hypothetical protein O6H91_18G013800 [Diphasiastrum complanatum]